MTNGRHILGIGRTMALACFVWLALAALAGCAHSPMAETDSSSSAGTQATTNVFRAAPTSTPLEAPQPAEAPDTVPLPDLPIAAAAAETVSGAATEYNLTTVWGITGLRGFAVSQQIAPNGLEYNALFAIDFDFNMMLCREHNIYLFSDAQFWGQKAAPGITNAHQGAFDFSKREFDFNAGVAWNYAGLLEARAFAYSFNNLNRGTSMTTPGGYADGFGLENRLYLSRNYADLGTDNFDIGRASFLSVGYFPTKDMVNADGDVFRPGPFVRAYLTVDLGSPQYYLYADAQFIASRNFAPEVFKGDAGICIRPFVNVPRLEFRFGSSQLYDLHHEWETSLYGQIRYLF
jgi:hypothetical protein